MSSSVVPSPAAAPSSSRLGFFDLPTEVQKEIFTHCSQGDLICSSLVSRAFRELAASQLYRNFNIVFPDEEDPSYDTPIDGLAGGLDTFVTSDYDYAKHLRDFSLDTLDAGAKAEAAYKPYLYSVSCGKFMNTLLYLTLKKAKSLEAFRWDVRVELSRPVYKALHDIDTLKILHLRLQAGPSLYEAPPPLPWSGTSSAVSSVVHLPDPVPPPPPPPPIFSPPFNIPAGAQVFYVAPTSAPPPPPPPPPKHVTRSRPFRKSNPYKEPPTLSGFKNLKTLSVLDIDSLEIVTELKACLRNSASTLTKLQLSFSDYLGSQARKPPPDLDPEDSDPEDDFPVEPNAPGSGFNDDVTGPARTFRALEERKTQEAVLGRIFDVEPYLIKKPTPKQTEDKDPGAQRNPSPSPGKSFIDSLTKLSRKLMEEVNESETLPTAHQDLLDLIEEAARKYVESDDSKQVRGQGKGPDGASPRLAARPASGGDASDAAKHHADGGLFQTATLKPKDLHSEDGPEDIDIEEPLEQLNLDPQESVIGQAAAEESAPPTTVKPLDEFSSELPPTPGRDSIMTGVDKAVSNLEAQKTNFKTLALKLDAFETQANDLNKEIQGLRASDGPATLDRLAEAEKQMQSFGRNIHDIQREMSVVEAEIYDAEKQIPSSQLPEGKEAAQQRRMTDYLRATRGLPLETLGIYLIPVKASVLHRAIDIRALRQITLLNVGPQGAIWTHFHKENRESPLALRKIFTDNVSMAFLNFVASLDEVHDLFMLERDNKYKPESFAPRSSVTITHIRRLVLKKHMARLQRLMVKNQQDQSWDFDEKTFSQVCGHGEKLEELACSTSIKAVHMFMRRMARLVNLRALHIVSLRNDDTCVWVLRETKEFLLDNLSHNPEMRLEWVSIDEDDRVDRILPPSELKAQAKKRKKAKKDKGKQKATSAPMNGSSSAFPLFPLVDSWDVDSDSDQDGENEATNMVERVTGVKFHDVWGVTIFRKEVVYGRL